MNPRGGMGNSPGARSGRVSLGERGLFCRVDTGRQGLA